MAIRKNILSPQIPRGILGAGRDPSSGESADLAIRAKRRRRGSYGRPIALILGSLIVLGFVDAARAGIVISEVLLSPSQVPIPPGDTGQSFTDPVTFILGFVITNMDPGCTIIGLTLKGAIYSERGHFHQDPVIVALPTTILNPNQLTYQSQGLYNNIDTTATAAELNAVSHSLSGPYLTTYFKGTITYTELCPGMPPTVGNTVSFQSPVPEPNSLVLALPPLVVGLLRARRGRCSPVGSGPSRPASGS